MNKVLNTILTIILFMMLCLTGTPIATAQTSSLDNSIYDYYQNKEKNSNDIEKQDDQVAGEEDYVPGESLDIGFIDVIQMLAALFFVILLLYFLLKFINSKSQSYKRNQLIQNLGGTSLGGNRSIQIVKVDHKLLIIGVGENIQLISEISDEEQVNSFLEQYNDQLDQYIQPMDIMTKWFKKMKPKEQVQHKSSFRDLLTKNLEEVKKEREKVFEQMEVKEKNQDE